jgi:hypothetical protein
MPDLPFVRPANAREISYRRVSWHRRGMIARLDAIFASTPPVRPVAQIAFFSFMDSSLSGWRRADTVSALSACAGLGA